MILSQKRHRNLIFAIGTNVSGNWGPPLETVRTALDRLSQLGVVPSRTSSIYLTKPVSNVRQNDVTNLVCLATTSHTPFKILRLFKTLERQAGRRLRSRNGPRELDLDLLDFGGRTINWPSGRRRQRLVLPHPEIAARAFVLAPLAELLPDWRHPVEKTTASRLLRQLHRQRGDVCRVAPPIISCDKEGWTPFNAVDCTRSVR